MMKGKDRTGGKAESRQQHTETGHVRRPSATHDPRAYALERRDQRIRGSKTERDIQMIYSSSNLFCMQVSMVPISFH